jgi:hypothetical protein
MCHFKEFMVIITPDLSSSDVLSLGRGLWKNKPMENNIHIIEELYQNSEMYQQYL